MPGFAQSACTGTVVRPGRSPWAQVRLAGHVDATASFELASALDELADNPLKWVYVDLAGVESADEVLPNFVVVLRCLLPHASVEVCRPKPSVRGNLEAAGIGGVITLRPDLPLLHVPADRDAQELR